MSALDNLEKAASDLMSLALEIRSGKETSPLSIGRRLIGIALDLAPGELKDDLTAQDRKWADLAADIAENTKLDAATDISEAEKLANAAKALK